MRRLASVCLGLALVAPAAARAGNPALAPVTDQFRKPPANAFATHYGGHICARCAANLPRRIPADSHGVPLSGPIVSPMAGPVTATVASVGCVDCQTAHPYSYGPDAPGVAYVGGDAPAYGYGGMMGSVEPAPIGVMRTDYQGAAPAAGAPGVNPMARGPYAPAASTPAPGRAGWGEPPLSHPTSNPGHRRPNVLGHMLGLRAPRPLGAARLERQRAAHAAIRYEAGAPGPDSLPASMVYGGR